MTIDLTSAGTRGLATLDSIADLQNVLKILNFKHDLVALRTNLAASDSALREIETFYRNNPYLDADVLQPPANNGVYGPRDLIFDNPMESSRTSLSDPLAISKLPESDSRIFQSSFPLVPMILLSGSARQLTMDFI